MTLHLGKKPYSHDPRDIKFKAVITAAQKDGITLPTPTPKFGHGLDYADWKMFGNGPDDSVAPGFEGCGDCVLADAGHATMLTNKMGGHPITITGKEVVQAYSDVTGYVVGDDSTDNGTEIRAALKWRRNTGIADANSNRHKIGAFVSIDSKNWHELMQAAYVFTAVSIGFEVPSYIWDMWDAGQEWDVLDPNAEIIGGHDVMVTGRNHPGACGVISWGKRVGMTRSFYEYYNDETWAVIFPEELRSGRTERGFDLTQLNAMLKELQ